MSAVTMDSCGRKRTCEEWKEGREAALDQKAAAASRGGDGVYAKEIAIKSAGASRSKRD